MILNMAFLLSVLVLHLTTDVSTYILKSDIFYISTFMYVVSLLSLLACEFSTRKTVLFYRDTLISLGFFGTILGFSYIFWNLNADTFSSVNNLPNLLVQIFTGVKVALNTTLIGIFMYMWLSLNLQIRKRLNQS